MRYDTQPDIKKCQCSFRIRMVGDGCQHCNPEFWKEFYKRQEEDDRRDSIEAHTGD